MARENLPPGGAARVVAQPEACLRAALPMLQRSFKECGRRPEDERLGLFAASTCEKGAKASRGRIAMARTLLRKHAETLPPDPKPEAASRL